MKCIIIKIIALIFLHYDNFKKNINQLDNHFQDIQLQSGVLIRIEKLKSFSRHMYLIISYSNSQGDQWHF